VIVVPLSVPFALFQKIAAVGVPDATFRKYPPNQVYDGVVTSAATLPSNAIHTTSNSPALIEVGRTTEWLVVFDPITPFLVPST
jgi:hypothetical protein